MPSRPNHDTRNISQTHAGPRKEHDSLCRHNKMIFDILIQLHVVIVERVESTCQNQTD